jgi:hypothetical protein
MWFSFVLMMTILGSLAQLGLDNGCIMVEACRVVPLPGVMVVSGLIGSML